MVNLKGVVCMFSATYKTRVRLLLIIIMCVIVAEFVLLIL